MERVQFGVANIGVFYFERRVRRLLAESAEASGAKPRGQTDKVLPPKKPVLAIPTSNQEPTLSVADWLIVVPTVFSPLTKVFRKGEFEGKNLFFKKGFPLILVRI